MFLNSHSWLFHELVLSMWASLCRASQRLCLICLLDQLSRWREGTLRLLGVEAYRLWTDSVFSSFARLWSTSIIGCSCSMLLPSLGVLGSVDDDSLLNIANYHALLMRMIHLDLLGDCWTTFQLVSSTYWRMRWVLFGDGLWLGWLVCSSIDVLCLIFLLASLEVHICHKVVYRGSIRVVETAVIGLIYYKSLPSLIHNACPCIKSRWLYHVIQTTILYAFLVSLQDFLKLFKLLFICTKFIINYLFLQILTFLHLMFLMTHEFVACIPVVATWQC